MTRSGKDLTLCKAFDTLSKITFSPLKRSAKAEPTPTGTGINRDEIMKINKHVILAVMFAITGCTTQNHTRYSQSRPPAATGRFPMGNGLFLYHPQGFAADVNHARVIDTDGYLYTFNTLDQTSPDPDSVDKWTDVTMAAEPISTKSKNRRSTLSSAGIPMPIKKPMKPAPYSGRKPGKE
jgi:hypothetical protein